MHFNFNIGSKSRVVVITILLPEFPIVRMRGCYTVSRQAGSVGTARRDAARHSGQVLHSPQVSALKCGAITG